jgi:hypothetical protein
MRLKGTKEPLIHPPDEALAGARNAGRGLRLLAADLPGFTQITQIAPTHLECTRALT